MPPSPPVVPVRAVGQVRRKELSRIVKPPNEGMGAAALISRFHSAAVRTQHPSAACAGEELLAQTRRERRACPKWSGGDPEVGLSLDLGISPGRSERIIFHPAKSSISDYGVGGDELQVQNTSGRDYGTVKQIAGKISR
ncbi:hypothetical protein SBV1_710021 [Verrucomicrobia bacterium]|nr:hypothetical protein SBV1_710021 [Verrucomicrobiota bacterium]